MVSEAQSVARKKKFLFDDRMHATVQLFQLSEARTSPSY